MSENSIVDEQASGDVTPVKLDEKLSEVEPPKTPDVELIVDGFGFMPKVPIGTKKLKDPKVSEEFLPKSEHSPCISSTNIDIVRRYTWKTKNKMTVQIISYGATITSIQVPDRKGVPTDVVAGFDTLDEYFQERNPYFGSTLGRYANYIRDPTIQIRPSGKLYALSTNRGKHHYNGGFTGFDKVNWRSYVSGKKVIMSHVSDRFHEGYPGSLMTQIEFEVTCDNTLKVEMKCTTSEPTIVNLSLSPYFNLAGHNSGPDALYNHIFTINADKYTAQDDEGFVTGEKKVVGGTSFDFRIPRVLKTMINKIAMGGYDLNYCVTQGIDQDLTFHARVLDPESGRVMEMYSNQPGMHFYTGNLLPDPEKIVEGKRMYGYIPLVGKGGSNYRKHGLFCIMPQNYPDAINHKHFPNSVLNPGEVYTHKIQYKFGLLLGKYV
ncbi:galactose mutarotase-like isoform X2 [Aricia agestis]|uniref:galactose mutarotase-like isoform X2 n=1 Tax=Aricia agestis TaxID=91739 RepID=UPI001C20B21F|nr:galactose mutarotase-like isoform X2 [Aricia agestis]